MIENSGHPFIGADGTASRNRGLNARTQTAKLNRDWISAAYPTAVMRDGPGGFGGEGSGGGGIGPGGGGSGIGGNGGCGKGLGEPGIALRRFMLVHINVSLRQY